MTDKPAGSFLLRLPSALESIEAGRCALMDYLAPATLSARMTNRLEVVFEELVSNIVRHGAATEIRVEAEMRDGEVHLAVEDDGPAFDPFDRPAPLRYTDITTATPGGRGIELVRKLTRHADYARRDGRNCVSVGIAAA